MNITMNRAELLHAVRRAVTIAPASSPLEVLKGVCLEVAAAGKSLVLTATNLEVTLKQKLTCDAQEDDALVIDARLLAGMLEKLPGDTVRLWRDAKGDQLKVWSGEAKYNVSVWERSSYPKAEIPAVSNLVQASGIPSMARRTVFAVDEKNEKPMLKCVQLRFTQDGLRAAGSDGNCVVTAKGDDKSTGDFSVLIPATSLGHLAQMCEDKDEFRVGTTGKWVVFVREGFLFSARLVEAEYIDADHITSSLQNQFTVLTDVAELRKCLDSVSCVEPGGKIRLSFEGMTLSFQCTGTYHLLQEILRNEFGFDGFVVSDWGGSNEHVEGVRAGSHLEMPTTGGDSDLELVQAVKDGKISEEIINQRVDELLDVILHVTAAVAPLEGKPFDIDTHHKMAMKAAGESIVLLKNEGKILPLKKGSKVAVIGEFAQKARYQGAGSSVVNATKVDNTMDIIGNYPLDVAGFEPGYPRSGKGDLAMQAKAVELAKKADIVLLYIGLDEISESEGLDRPHMKLPQSQIDLLEAVAAVNPNVVAVMSAGSAVEMPWLDKCKALIHGCLCGQAGAGAMLQAILGEINPSGKLAESYPVKYEDVSSAPYFPAKQRTAEYREGLYVGYRYFETANIPVLFPFGFGLSYTTFQYSDLKVTDKEATFTLTNTGSVAGAEVAQLYVGKKDSQVFRPAKELKGFAKVFLKAGESKTITIPLDDKAFRYFNVKTNQFEIEGGAYQIMIGASVADIKLSGSVSVQGTNAPDPYDAKELADYYSGQIKAVSDRQFEALLGRPIPDGSWSGTLTMNDALCQMYYAKSGLARFVYKRLTSMIDKSMEKGKPNLNLMFNYNMPFRGIAKMTGGMCTMEMAEGILIIVNGHFFKGLGQIIGGFFRAGKKRKAANSPNYRLEYMVEYKEDKFENK